jgi:hypothetical protein
MLGQNAKVSMTKTTVVALATASGKAVRARQKADK